MNSNIKIVLPQYSQYLGTRTELSTSAGCCIVRAGSGSRAATGGVGLNGLGSTVNPAAGRVGTLRP
jgi:hypothetical protein